MNNDDFKKCFIYSPQFGCWMTGFKGTPAFVSCSADIDMSKMTYEEASQEKPAYIAVMASRKQLQPILDNQHLFDTAFINAIRIAINHYEYGFNIEKK